MPIEIKRIVVAGAAGFIGTNFIKRLANNEHYDVIGIFNTKKPSIEADNISYLQADLRNLDECKQVVKEDDYVCMFAGRLSTTSLMLKNPLGPITDNTVINVNMLEAALLAGINKYLWLSSTTGYPQLDRPLLEEDYFDSDPPSPYEPVGWMSRYIEKLSSLYSTKPNNSMTVICLRPTAIYGEHDDYDFQTCHVLPALIRRVVERYSPIEIWGSGEDTRDWLYIEDLIDACLLALENIDGYVALNICNGKSYSVNQLLENLLDIDGYHDAQIVYNRKNNSQEIKREFDYSLAEKLIGFKAKTSINRGLKQTLNWYKKSKFIKESQ